MNLSFNIEGGDFTKAGCASSEVKKMLKQLNISPEKIKKIAIAMYEAEVNVVAHAYQGTMDVEIEPTHVKIKFTDKGPGIADIDKAMVAGFSTASEQVRQMGFGAGMGLPNIKKNVDELKIKSEVDKGTEVEFITRIS